LSLGAKERRFEADSDQKYEDSMPKYQAWPRRTVAWPRHQSLKLIGQVRELARPVPLATRPCHHHSILFAAFASRTSCLFSLFLT